MKQISAFTSSLDNLAGIGLAENTRMFVISTGLMMSEEAGVVLWTKAAQRRFDGDLQDPDNFRFDS